MSVVLIRSLILYIVVIFGVRLMGKRQLGELQPSELVITILISNIATLPLEDTSIPLILGILPILTLVCFEALMSWVTLKSLRMRRIISGRPKIVVRDGQIEQATMQDLRLSVDDLMTALRQQQVFDISQVQFAVMETTGTISVYLKAECQPLTPADITLKKTAQNPPVAVIQDGNTAYLCGILFSARRSLQLLLLPKDQQHHAQQHQNRKNWVSSRLRDC